MLRRKVLRKYDIVTHRLDNGIWLIWRSDSSWVPTGRLQMPRHPTLLVLLGAVFHRHYLPRLLRWWLILGQGCGRRRWSRRNALPKLSSLRSRSLFLPHSRSTISSWLYDNEWLFKIFLRMGNEMARNEDKDKKKNEGTIWKIRRSQEETHATTSPCGQKEEERSWSFRQATSWYHRYLN